MKNLYIATLALISTYGAVAQETVSVEKSLFNVQTGAVGAWVSYEARLSNRWALRTEVGLDLWTFETTNTIGTKKTDYFFLPSIAVEPRWYYNIQKRSNKGYHTANNSANFVTLAVEYYSDALKIGAPNYVRILDQISFVPKWGHPTFNSKNKLQL